MVESRWKTHDEIDSSVHKVHCGRLVRFYPTKLNRILAKFRLHNIFILIGIVHTWEKQKGDSGPVVFVGVLNVVLVGVG
jgi:hypothetical protein